MAYLLHPSRILAISQTSSLCAKFGKLQIAQREREKVRKINMHRITPARESTLVPVWSHCTGGADHGPVGTFQRPIPGDAIGQIQIANGKETSGTGVRGA